MTPVHVMWTLLNNLMASYPSNKLKPSASTSIEFPASVVNPTIPMPQHVQVLPFICSLGLSSSSRYYTILC